MVVTYMWLCPPKNFVFYDTSLVVHLCSKDVSKELVVFLHKHQHCNARELFMSNRNNINKNTSYLLKIAP